MEAKGKVRESLKVNTKVAGLVATALGCIDTGEQYKIRTHLEEALKLLSEERDKYDPL